ncbi:MAG: TIGR00159 family protein [Ruminococcaceae bacterium]|nr:TIGR00159 family protein [Oscillospiraceae bacterium]
MKDLFSWLIIILSVVIDVTIVSFLFYKVITFFRNTRAYQLLKGIALVLIIAQLSEIFGFSAVSFILKNTLQVGLIAVVILFQPEIRKGLSDMGSRGFKFLNVEDNRDNEAVSVLIKNIVSACLELSKMGHGALIVFERKVKIGDVIRTGINLNSAVSTELLVNIFIPNTPLHDGAVVIGEDKIKAAACFLPLSQNETLPSELGTRHRAGIGITESTDAISVIVSEETGKISVAADGVLTRNLNEDKLYGILKQALFSENRKEKKSKKVWRFNKNEK